MAENQEPVKVEEQGPFIHQLQLFLVGGQQFTVNELSDSVKMPQNVIAFINAWRQKRDVWHSLNNDPKFGVRVKDVSLYEYRVGKASAVKPAESVAAPAPAAAPAVEAEPAIRFLTLITRVRDLLSGSSGSPERNSGFVFL